MYWLLLWWCMLLQRGLWCTKWTGRFSPTDSTVGGGTPWSPYHYTQSVSLSLFCKSLNICECFIFSIMCNWCASRIQNLVKIECQIHIQMSVHARHKFLYLKIIKKYKHREIKTLLIISESLYIQFDCY